MTCPEQAYVRALASIAPSPTALELARAALKLRGFSAAAACELAARNWVLPAVAHNTRSHPDLCPPGSSAADSQFRLATATAQLRLTTIERHLAPVCERWNSSGIPWALMKGAALIASIYPPGTRLLNDVDVLVSFEAYDAARRVLLESGFVPLNGNRNEQEWLKIKGATTFSNRDAAGSAATTIDLHTQTYAPDRPYQFMTADLLSRRRPAHLGAIPVSVLDPADVLLHLATQLVNDRLLTTLLRLADLDLLFCRTDAAECERRAAETGSGTALAFARAAAAQVFPGAPHTPAADDPLPAHAAKIARTLIRRGWPWADALEQLPESYRLVAADVLEEGFRCAIARSLSLQRAINYQRNRRQSGASVTRSLLGGVRMAVRNTVALARVGWDLRSV